jgi:hypothetical protein
LQDSPSSITYTFLKDLPKVFGAERPELLLPRMTTSNLLSSIFEHIGRINEFINGVFEVV